MCWSPSLLPFSYCFHERQSNRKKHDEIISFPIKYWRKTNTRWPDTLYSANSSDLIYRVPTKSQLFGPSPAQIMARNEAELSRRIHSGRCRVHADSRSLIHQKIFNDREIRADFHVHCDRVIGNHQNPRRKEIPWIHWESAVSLQVTQLCHVFAKVSILNRH